MYFALEEEPQLAAKCSALWAIDLDWLKAKECELFESEGALAVSGGLRAREDCLNRLNDQDKEPVIVKIDPPETNERMSAQQGFFLWKRFEETPFFDQILMTMIIHPEIPDRPVIRKLEVGRDQRIKFLRKLREKNIHRASLFPGFDGFCDSLKRDLEIEVKEAARGLSVDD